jgi:hypothetical protein
VFNYIEYGLARPVAGGPSLLSLGAKQLSAPEFSADDTHELWGIAYKNKGLKGLPTGLSKTIVSNFAKMVNICFFNKGNSR